MSLPQSSGEAVSFGPTVARIAPVAALSLLVCVNAAPGDFVWKDVSLITRNNLIREWGNLPRILASDYWDLGPFAQGDYWP